MLFSGDGRSQPAAGPWTLSCATLGTHTPRALGAFGINERGSTCNAWDQTERVWDDCAIPGREVGVCHGGYVEREVLYSTNDSGRSAPYIRELADRVEHAAVDRGDGLGFDVLSFEENGRERFIEVKTTAFARETPFFVTRNELDFSRTFAPQFRLYRRFQFRRDPRMFVLEGAVDERGHLNPVSYRAELR